MSSTIKRIIGVLSNMTIPLSSAVQTSMTSQTGPGELALMDDSVAEATPKNGSFLTGLESHKREGLSRVKV